MQIFTNGKEQQQVGLHRIYEDDIQIYGKKLLNLVQLYRKHIYIKNAEDLNTLSELEYYAMQIMNRQYQNIITNHSEIISSDDSDSEVPF